MNDVVTPKIYAAMSKVNIEMGAIEKDQQGFGYKFRGINQVLNTLNPLFKKHEIITTRANLYATRNTRTVTDRNGKEKEYIEVFMECDYIFTSLEDGSTITTRGFGEGQDTSGGDKASSMATSNSYKYVIFELFNIPTEEQKDSDQVTAIVNNVMPAKKAVNVPKKAVKEVVKEEIKVEVKKESEERGRGFRRKKVEPIVEDENDL